MKYEEKLVRRYESSTNSDEEAVIKKIQVLLSDIETYTENSKIDIEILVVGKLDRSVQNSTVEFKGWKTTYQGMRWVKDMPIEKKVPTAPTEAFDKFVHNLLNSFKIIQIDRCKWNNDGTFA